MGYTVAMGGKGGTGKTTLAGLLIRYMIRKGMRPVLAVDADANVNLNDVLGVPLTETLSDAREGMRDGVPTGMTKDIYMEMKVEQAMVEAEGFDLVAMGRPEGSGCYCAANNLLSCCLDRLIKNYEYMVVDNEAGMEHFSRLNRKDVDLLILVSDGSRRGLTAARRIADLVESLPIRVSRTVLVVNRLEEAPAAWPEDVTGTFGAENIFWLPSDPLLAQYDREGRPTSELPEDAGIVRAAEAFFDRVVQKKNGA